MKIITSLMLFVFLAGCGAEEQDTEKEFIFASIAAREEAEKLANELAEQKRTWVDEFNYFETLENGSSPARIQRAELWPIEDLSDESSYDMPRIQFIWNNQMHSTYGQDEQLTKIWSAKVDGTDLRLVGGKSVAWGNIRVARRSPDNRYVAFSRWVNSDTEHHVLDIKTQVVKKIGQGGEPSFVWAEDSKYVYFTDSNSRDLKYNIKTGEVTNTNVEASQQGVIVNGKVINLNHFGVAVIDEATGELDYTILNFDGEGNSLQYEMREQRVISPDGKFAWGSSGLMNFWFDIEKRTVKKVGQATGLYQDVHMISTEGKYVIWGPYRKGVFKQDHQGRRERVASLDAPMIGGNIPYDYSLYSTLARNGEILPKGAVR
ncbi:hypothetical protein [Vibrio sp. WXL103]|uniref:hypothetical protein n=1 Tax=Vibrio sp. WXL103 TaxID=3450710 RepID=UPI003EC65C2D